MGKTQNTDGLVCISSEFKRNDFRILFKLEILVGRTISGFKAGNNMAQFAFWKGPSAVSGNWLTDAWR